MWATYDYTHFPLINVSFNENINSDDEFEDFLNEWKLLYENKKNFEFIFDTKNCGYINPKYCFSMSYFIKKLKKEKIQYLKKSTIYVYHKFIWYLLKLIFVIERPVAPVYIIYINNENNIENQELINP